MNGYRVAWGKTGANLLRNGNLKKIRKSISGKRFFSKFEGNRKKAGELAADFSAASRPVSGKRHQPSSSCR